MIKNDKKNDQSKFQLLDRHNELRAWVANGREAGQPQVSQNFQQNHTLSKPFHRTHIYVGTGGKHARHEVE